MQLKALVLAASLLMLAMGSTRAADAASPAAPAASGPTTNGTNSADFFKDWAVGLAILKPSKRGVSDATIANNTVRVNSETTSETMILVARHFYPFRGDKQKTCTTSSMAGFWSTCVGAMVGVGLGSSGGSGGSQIINFAGVGLTAGGGVDDNAFLAWHFGIGVGRRFNMRVLGDGFTANAAPPTGETQIRYKTIDVNSPFVYFTTHW